LGLFSSRVVVGFPGFPPCIFRFYPAGCPHWIIRAGNLFSPFSSFLPSCCFFLIISPVSILQCNSTVPDPPPPWFLHPPQLTCPPWPPSSSNQLFSPKFPPPRCRSPTSVATPINPPLLLTNSPPSCLVPVPFVPGHSAFMWFLPSRAWLWFFLFFPSHS